MSNLNISFDGFGLNNANDPYKTRLLTFTQSVSEKDRADIARLLIAAPELLKQLEEALEIIDSEYSSDDAVIGPVMARIRALISRVKG